MASSAGDEDSVDIIFHGSSYNLAVLALEGEGGAEPSLCIDLEELESGASWHGEFSASYVESITSKTGNFKRFSVLVKMLITAMRQQTETVFLDLLTYNDLEMLKHRKSGKPGQMTPAQFAAAAAAGGGRGNKRYLILTYAVEFDRVHYPLPLSPPDSPSVSVLQRQVRRLRREVEVFRALGGIGASAPALGTSGMAPQAQAQLVTSVSGLTRENELLKSRNAELQAHLAGLQEQQRASAEQLAAIQESSHQGDAALEKLRQASKMEVKRLRAEITELRNKLQDSESAASAASEAAMLHAHGSRSRGAQENDVVSTLKATVEQLRNKVRDLTKQVALSSTAAVNSSQLQQRGRSSTPVSVASGRTGSSSRSSIGVGGPRGGGQVRAGSSGGSSIGGRSAASLRNSPLAQPMPRGHLGSSSRGGGSPGPGYRGGGNPSGGYGRGMTPPSSRGPSPGPDRGGQQRGGLGPSRSFSSSPGSSSFRSPSGGGWGGAQQQWGPGAGPDRAGPARGPSPVDSSRYRQQQQGSGGPPSMMGGGGPAPGNGRSPSPGGGYRAGPPGGNSGPRRVPTPTGGSGGGYGPPQQSRQRSVTPTRGYTPSRGYTPPGQSGRTGGGGGQGPYGAPQTLAPPGQSRGPYGGPPPGYGSGGYGPGPGSRGGRSASPHGSGPDRAGGGGGYGPPPASGSGYDRRGGPPPSGYGAPPPSRYAQPPPQHQHQQGPPPGHGGGGYPGGSGPGVGRSPSPPPSHAHAGQLDGSSAFLGMPGGGGGPAAPAQSAPGPGGSGGLDASTEIADIDARLAQLQDFLRAAKG